MKLVEQVRSPTDVDVWQNMTEFRSMSQMVFSVGERSQNKREISFGLWKRHVQQDTIFSPELLN